ncbi:MULTISPECIES: tetratricopeptide repeat protein [Pseudomonas]|jgi:Flp pilus assembly protein TadD|uniref:tetratricopeptide repeat protein n=1 Tax=Pseudomonas TaxID=286 RepID=UPI00087613E2|nr:MULTISPECIES: tetratricopeptide repeat protein [Pseudomonas]UVM11760.1 tetratricopeptide repeat protein [Pseudomonas protegens]SCZ73611.1 Flp pilus assembly protein TadD, contains TPR repeats [Pseudomonas sp. NFPP17]SDA79656.1 Flp pilus assembly protein TadD, contains TPR repeats [Pseudomonas sp. NFPP15]SEL48487.1 Flp pilus assembly protein TadD, contains TPR repeats [Pseudomonas sp. NFPP18]SFA65391.1 Flp pilus assembly protein TadD, contains TPR repeats [Pseudomonas sp. NFPP13]
MKAIIVVASLLLLGGCASNGQTPWAALTNSSSCAKLSSEQELAVNLADEMATDGKLHASLANLQNLPDNLAEVRVRKARVYRLLGRSEAEPLYRSLLGSCLAAEGEHGLGQLAAARGDNGQAQAHLQRAARLAPTNEKIRNDLGVVYLNQLRIEDARFEFLTAIELKQSEPLAAINLVTLLLYQDNWQQAAQVVSQASLNPQQFAQAQARAEELKAPTAPRAKVTQVASGATTLQPDAAPAKER